MADVRPYEYSYRPADRRPMPARLMSPMAKCVDGGCGHSIRIHGSGGCLALRCPCAIIYEEMPYDREPD